MYSNMNNRNRGNFRQQHQQRGGGNQQRGPPGARGGGGGAFQRLGGPYQRGNFRGRQQQRFQRNHRIGGPTVPGRSGQIPEKTWFKISIPRGKEFGRDFILKSLHSHVDSSAFWPLLFRLNDDNKATFFVDSKDVADAIEATSRRIQAPNGQKIIVNVISHGAPYIPVTEDERAAIQSALELRYDATNQNWNLTNFVLDPALQNMRMHNLSLQRNSVMMAVVELIGNDANLSQNTRSIDVSENRLRYLEYLANLVPRTPNVTRLILHHNQIDTLAELEKLSGWNLTELDLDETPLCARYRDRNIYTSDIRRIFPKLIKLDGVNLPPATRFGLDEVDDPIAVSSLPPFKPSFFINDEIKSLVSRFIEAYYTVFDGEDRQKRQGLLEAYDDAVVFTMTCHNLTREGFAVRGQSWSQMTRDSHNIMKQEVWERFRMKLVQRNKLAVLAYLCNEVPPTAHIPESFVVDISFATGNILCVNVNGIFHDCTSEYEHNNRPMRFFNRVFLLVQNEKGLCIVNEELFVSTMSEDEFETYMKQVGRTTTTTAMPSTSAPAEVPLATQPVIMNTEITREQLVHQFSTQSGMKMEWAKKCLEDYEWDYMKAVEAFTTFNQEGKIPASAFL